MKKRAVFSDCFLIIVTVILINFIICVFSGIWPWDSNPYNTYALQALSWLDGRLDLPMDYAHLEIARYQDKFFVIFPPFPSVITLPFAFFFGADTPDHLICMAFMALGGVYAYRIGLSFRLRREDALFWSVFLTVGNNTLLIASRGWVWFIAQTMSVTFTLMAFYYAACDKVSRSGLSLLMLCCAFGCRPFQIIYTPLVIYFLYKRYTVLAADKKASGFLLRLFVWALPAAALGVGYMLLNYFRFGNVLNFGREYLPEFANSPFGEFSLRYLPANLKNLLALPYPDQGRLRFQKFNGTAFYLVMPLYISFAVYFTAGMLKGSSADRGILAALASLTGLHILLLCMHITMGGWQFGNRYVIDALPAAYLGTVCLERHFGGLRKLNYPLLLAGLALNTAGTVYFHLDLL